MSENALHALKDMVELRMYLVAQSQQRPWPMMPRCRTALREAREPYRNPIEWSAASELVKSGLIEYSSGVTLVVSRSGQEFYEQEMKLKSADSPVE